MSHLHAVRNNGRMRLMDLKALQVALTDAIEDIKEGDSLTRVSEREGVPDESMAYAASAQARYLSAISRCLVIIATVTLGTTVLNDVDLS